VILVLYQDMWKFSFFELGKSCLPDFKLFWLHINFAELGETATQLEKRLQTLQDPHVSEADLLDELQLCVLG